MAGHIGEHDPEHEIIRFSRFGVSAKFDTRVLDTRMRGTAVKSCQGRFCGCICTNLKCLSDNAKNTCKWPGTSENIILNMK